MITKISLNLEDSLFIKKEAWHQIINPNKEPCHIVEIQYGDKILKRADIERLRYFEESSCKLLKYLGLMKVSNITSNI